MAAVGGCAEKSLNGTGTNYYMLDVSREKLSSPATTEKVLIVRCFDISSRFRSSQLVYRTGEVDYETDSYNQFLNRPELSVSEQTRQWLSSSGVFKSVVNPGSNADPTHILEANITSFYGDFRDKTDLKAVMAIRFFLIEDLILDNKVVFDKSYEAEAPLDSPSAQDLIKAYNQALADILTQFESDLKNAI